MHEIGCGAGYLVANTALVFPEILVTGSDRGQTQIDLARKRHAQLVDKFMLQDITMPYSRNWQRADLVYSQAVLMHIHTAVSHFVALANMFALSNKYVLLLENFQCHNFCQDIQNLFLGGHLSWEKIYAYKFSGSTGGNGVLYSKESLNYPQVNSEEEFRCDLKFSKRKIDRANQDSARGIFGINIP